MGASIVDQARMLRAKYLPGTKGPFPLVDLMIGLLVDENEDLQVPPTSDLELDQWELWLQLVQRQPELAEKLAKSVLDQEAKGQLSRDLPQLKLELANVLEASLKQRLPEA